MRSCEECGLRYESDDQYCAADGTPLVESNDPLIGESIGKYRLVRRIGSGGMGEVYLGLHPKIGSRVAIKVLSAAASQDAELVRRFFAEAQSVNRIRHESIVNVLDLDSLDDGRPFIIMEFLDGEPLSSMLERERLPIGSTARLGTEILHALSAAHDAGVVHRDLKPDNIFITQQGRVKILDFGIAKLMPGYDATNTPSSTRTGSLLGTPAYMSPEQVIGREVGPETDLFALGAILYECLAGRRAFDGTSLFALMQQVVHDEPPPLSTLRPDVPPALEGLIRRAMAKVAKERFASADEMSQELERQCSALRGEDFAPLRPRAGAGKSKSASGAKSHGNTAFAETGYSGKGDAVHSSLAMANTQAPTHPMPGRTPAPASSVAMADTQAATQPMPGRDGAKAQQPSMAWDQTQAAAALGLDIPTREAPRTQDEAMAYAPPVSTSVESKGRRLLIPALALLAVGGGGAAFFLNQSSDEDAAPSSRTQVASVVASDAAPAAAATVLMDASTEDLTPSQPDAGAGAAESPGAPPVVAKNRTTRKSASKPDASVAAEVPSFGRSAETTEAEEVSKDEPELKERLAAQGVTAIETGERHKDKMIRIPPDFNPKAFDAAAYVSKARAHAKKIYSDAYLFEFDVAGVRPHGKSNLGLANFEATYYFLSPSHAKRTMPLGVEEDLPCKVYVEVSKSGTVARIVETDDCKGKRRPNPKCSMKEVWDRAIKLGAPSDNVVAEIDYLWDGWYFSIDPINFNESIPDDC